MVAYAIAGTVRFDIEQDVLGTDKNGHPVTLKDLWPSDEEIDAIVAASVKPEQFKQVYIPMFDLGSIEEAKSPLYDWRPMSTYIRRPPYWEGALAGERTLKGMRPLAILPDNITTDHLSPSNAILPDSAAGEYLAKMGLPEEDFNSYATHRGDHLTAQRATFANPQLVNEMAVVDGKVQKGSLARVEPEGQVMRMWEAIETYMNRKQNLIIVAGADYGQGSSRDWAAKGVRLAGVEVIVAEGFERIHRTNLVGMGVLPVEFKPGTTRLTLGLDGTETYDIEGELSPRCDLTLVVHRKNGKRPACRSRAASTPRPRSASTRPVAYCSASPRISSARPEARQFRTCSVVRSQSVCAAATIHSCATVRWRSFMDQIPMAHFPQIRIPATYMRGGTSKGVFFRLQDLPQSCQVPGAARDKLFMRVIGSPDPYSAHIDGMGGATSSTSKCVILSKSSRPDHDVSTSMARCRSTSPSSTGAVTAATSLPAPVPSRCTQGWWTPRVSRTTAPA